MQRLAGRNSIAMLFEVSVSNVSRDCSATRVRIVAVVCGGNTVPSKGKATVPPRVDTVQQYSIEGERDASFTVGVFFWNISVSGHVMRRYGSCKQSCVYSVVL